MASRTQQRRTLSDAQAACIKSMTDEHLEALCAGLNKPDLSGFSDAELESITTGSAPDALIRRYDAAIQEANP